MKDDSMDSSGLIYKRCQHLISSTGSSQCWRKVLVPSTQTVVRCFYHQEEDMADNSGLVKVRCCHIIEGPKRGKHVVAWRSQCRRTVSAPANRSGYAKCWQHTS